MLDLTAIKARLAEHKRYRNTPIGANGNVISFADIDALLLEIERLQQIEIAYKLSLAVDKYAREIRELD